MSCCDLCASFFVSRCCSHDRCRDQSVALDELLMNISSIIEYHDYPVTIHNYYALQLLGQQLKEFFPQLADRRSRQSQPLPSTENWPS